MLKGERGQEGVEDSEATMVGKETKQVNFWVVNPPASTAARVPLSGKSQRERAQPRHAQSVPPRLHPRLGLIGVKTGLGAKSQLIFSKALEGGQGRNLYPPFTTEPEVRGVWRFAKLSPASWRAGRCTLALTAVGPGKR